MGQWHHICTVAGVEEGEERGGCKRKDMEEEEKNYLLVTLTWDDVVERGDWVCMCLHVQRYTRWGKQSPTLTRKVMLWNRTCFYRIACTLLCGAGEGSMGTLFHCVNNVTKHTLLKQAWHSHKITLVLHNITISFDRIECYSCLYPYLAMSEKTGYPTVTAKRTYNIIFNCLFWNGHLTKTLSHFLWQTWFEPIVAHKFNMHVHTVL